jgi:hypothetical protein
MSKYLLSGSLAEPGLQFLRLAAKSKLELKCLIAKRKWPNRIDRSQLIVSGLGGIPAQLPITAESLRDHGRILKPLLKPILEGVDGVLFFCQDVPAQLGFRISNDLDKIVLSALQESTPSPRILVLTKIPGRYLGRYHPWRGTQERLAWPPAEMKDFLDMVENAQGVDWTIVRSAQCLDDRFDQESSDRRAEIPPKGGIAVGANSDSAIWWDDLSSVLLEVLKTDGLTGRTLDVQSVKPTKDNNIKKVLAEVAASPKKKSDTDESV